MVHGIRIFRLQSYKRFILHITSRYNGLTVTYPEVYTYTYTFPIHVICPVGNKHVQSEKCIILNQPRMCIFKNATQCKRIGLRNHMHTAFYQICLHHLI